MINKMQIAILSGAEMLESKLCDYNDAYILVKEDITVIAAVAIQVSLKNCRPFAKYITTIDGATIDDAEELDLSTSMYNLIEYSLNYSDSIRILWFYIKDEMKHLILMLILLIIIILNLLNIRINYWETQLLSPLQIKLMGF